jgi:hypothetical protein
MAEDITSGLEKILSQKSFKAFSGDLKESLKGINANEKAVAALTKSLDAYSKVSNTIEETLQDISKTQKENNKQYKVYLDFTKSLTKAMDSLKRGSKDVAEAQLKQAKSLSKSLDISKDLYASVEKSLDRVISKTEQFAGTSVELSEINAAIGSVSNSVEELASGYSIAVSQMVDDQKDLSKLLTIHGDKLAKSIIGQSESTEDLVYNIDRQTASTKLLNEISSAEQQLADKFNITMEDNVFNSTEAIKSAEELAKKKTLLSSAAKILNENVDKSGKTYLTYNEALQAATILQEKAEQKGRKLAKVQELISTKTKLAMTAGGLAVLTWHNWSKQVERSTDIQIEASTKLADTFGQGMKDAISRTMNMSVAMTKVDITAIKLGVDVDILRGNFSYLAKTLKTTDANVIAKLTSDTSTLARVMGSDYFQVIDSVATKTFKFGKTSAQATDELSYMYTTITDINEIAGKAVVHLDEVSNIINEASNQTSAYSQNTKELTGAVNQAILALQAQGKTYRQSSDAAKGMMGIFESAPDWMQWQAGFDLQRTLRNDKKAMADLKAEMPGMSDELDELAAGGAASARVLWDMSKTSSTGLEIMSNQVNKLAGNRGLGEAAYVLQSQIGGTFSEAQTLVSLFREIDQAGSFENFSKGMDRSYEELKVLSGRGVPNLAKALGMTKNQAEELATAISKGPEEGEKAYKKYNDSIKAAMISQQESSKVAKDKEKGIGSATDALVKNAQAALSSASILTDKFVGGIVKTIEDQPILTGLLAAFTGGKALLTKKPSGQLTPDTLAITGGSSLKRIEMAVQYSGKSLTSSIPKKIQDVIGSLVGKIPGIGGKGALASKAGLLTGGAAGVKGIAAMLGGAGVGIGGGLLSSFGIGKLRKEDEAEKGRRELGGNIGTGAGTLIGTLLGGPIGAAIGGAAGGAIGSAVGKFLPEIKSGISTFFTGVSGAASQLWENIKNMFKDIPTAVKTILLDGLLGGFTSVFDSIKALLHGDFKEALISAVQAIIPFGKIIRKTTSGVVESSAVAIVEKEKETEAARKKAEADKKAIDDKAKEAQKEKELHNKYRGSGRSATYYKRFVTGERITRGLSPTPNSALAFSGSSQSMYTPTAIPMPETKSSSYVPTALPKYTGTTEAAAGSSKGRTVSAKAIGMRGNNAILEILNFDTLLAQNNRNIMQATM